LFPVPDVAFITWLNNNGFAGCLNGNMLDTTCSAVVNATNMNFTGTYDISNLTGIVYFDSLDTLYVFANNLTALPTFPPGLSYLDCSFNEIVSLGTLPNGLRYLEVDNNLLTALPATLPDSLRIFHCEKNQLTALPTLPDSLNILWCHENQITSLPLLPPALMDLSCYKNQLTVLPDFPATMHMLDCSNNQITELPDLLPGLNFVFLTCRNNLLDSLPELPPYLYSLNCDSNQITELPSMNNLGSLNCSSNQLTDLPPVSLNMQNLFCYDNLLTSIPELPDGLNIFWCNANQLTSLPSLPESISNLDISDNPMLFCLPAQQYLNSFKWYNTGITCLPNVMTVNTSVPLVDTVPVCGLFNAGNCNVLWNINGKVFSDSVSNCTIDPGESRYKNVKVNLYRNGILEQQTYTSLFGEYTFDTDTGTFYYSLDTANVSFNVTCPVGSGHTSVISAADSFEVDKNFAIECAASFDVGVIGVVPFGIFRSGDTVYVKAVAGDLSQFVGLNCANGLAGSVRIIIDGPAYYNGITPGALTPTVNGDTLDYAITDFGLLTFQNEFGFTIVVNSSAAIGDQVCVQVEVNPVAGDLNPSNNNYSFCATVNNSYDPNDKLVNPEGIIDTSQVSLNYTIRFQNTGTAPAKHIVIIDTLDASINPASFQLVSYSFPPLIQVTGNIIKFIFQNIELPDSTNDEPNSHGYVQYNVRLNEQLPIGTEIYNTAYIYFDFNTPVQTNTTYNIIDVVSGMQTINGIQKVNVYPNPTYSNSELLVTGLNNEPFTFSINDINGKVLFNTQGNGGLTAKILLPELASGAYFFGIKTERYSGWGKLIVLGE
jgi:uncharacterized repeat protein (TIGR01451 family)